MKQKEQPFTEIHLIPFQHKIIPVKNLSSRFYEQLLPEPIIDATTVTLQGTPLGWINQHDRTCPREAHYHVVWSKGDSALRIAISYQDGPSKESAYRKERARYTSRLNKLVELLPLLLAPTHRYDLAHHRVVENSDVIKINGPIFVYTRSGIELLEHLERARQQLQQDQQEWEAWANQWDDECEHCHGGWNLEQDKQQALSIQQTLRDAGVCLAHPTLYKQMEQSSHFASFRENCWEYALTDGYEMETLTREQEPTEEVVEIDWDLVVDDPHWHDPYNPPLRWSIQETKYTQVSSSFVKMMTATFIRPLRIVLAEQAMATALLHVERAAFDLVGKCDAFPSSQLPTPEVVYQLLQQTEDQLNALTQKWETAYQSLSIDVLEQLFIQG